MCCSNGYNRILRSKPYKTENNTGCNCYPKNNECNGISNALEGSTLWNWEQEHGKVIVEVLYELNEEGRFMQTIKKSVCPPKKSQKRMECCSLRYRV